MINNPFNLFHDPEFLQLNPGVDWPSGSPGNHVLLLGDLSDTTEALTRWLWSDPAARAFLKGKPDPWGMTVNSNYKNLELPFSTFPLLDQNLSISFAPIQGMDTLSRQLSIAQFPGALVSAGGRRQRHRQAAPAEPGCPRGDRHHRRRRRRAVPAADGLAGERTGGAFVKPDHGLDPGRHGPRHRRTPTASPGAST